MPEAQTTLGDFAIDETKNGNRVTIYFGAHFLGAKMVSRDPSSPGVLICSDNEGEPMLIEEAAVIAVRAFSDFV